MTATYRTRSLRRGLLLAMVFSIFLALLFDRIYEYSIVKQHELEQQSLEQVREMSYTLARDYSQLLMAGRLQDLRLSITARGTQVLIKKVAVSDHHSIVLASSHLDDHGRSMQLVDELYDAAVAQQVTINNRIQVKLSAEGKSVLGYAPVSLQPKLGELRSVSQAVLFVHMDIVPLKAAIWWNLVSLDSVLRWLSTFALATLMLGYMLKRYLFQPLEHLEQTANRLGSGDWQARSELSGNGELAKLGRIFNEMREHILGDISRRKKTEAELRELNSRLEVLASTDQLTSIANRRHMVDVLDSELSRAERYSTGLSVLLLDVDFFKSINDQCGHDAGDVVLQQIAEILSGYSRKSDHVGRWGGEEFLIICPETDQDAAANLAELLRQRIEQHDFNIPLQITASFGVATYQPGVTADTLLKWADDALYQAKSDSRNCVRQSSA